MRKQITIDEVKCDMCNKEITDLPRSAVRFGDEEFDLCLQCESKVKDVTNFIRTRTPADIDMWWGPKEGVRHD